MNQPNVLAPPEKAGLRNNPLQNPLIAPHMKNSRYQSIVACLQASLKPGLWMVLFLLIAFPSLAGEQTFSALYSGAQINVSSAPLELEDARWTDMQIAGWENDFVNHKVSNLVRLQYTGQDQVFYGPGEEWFVKVDFTVLAWDENGAPLLPYTSSLRVDYDDDLSYVMRLYIRWPVTGITRCASSLPRLLPMRRAMRCRMT